MSGPGPAQTEVRRTMLEAGGYWRPLAAVARLLEELGELLELLQEVRPDTEELAGELADLWIITTALADQFLIEVGEPGASPAQAGTASSSALVIAAGVIARIVNYYDGPKTPRAAGELPSLAEAIGSFHGVLEGLSSGAGVDLGTAVTSKLGAIRRSPDMSRFAREASDPSTAAVLGLLGPGSGVSRVWGAPGPTTAQQAPQRAAALVPSLLAFTKAARAERLEAYVIGAPAAPGSAELDDWLSELLAELRLAATAPAESGSNEAARLWFNGLELVVSVHPAAARPAELAGVRAAALVLLSPAGGVLASPADDRT